MSLNRRELITKSLMAAALLAMKRGSVLADAVGVKRLDLTPGNVCTLTCRSTLGPCFFEGRVARRDITEGQPGMPTLLSFLVVNADTCQPVAGAAIDIWHVNASGLYSGPISNFCTTGNAVARASTFCVAFRPPTPTAGRTSIRFIPAGTAGARRTSTRRCASTARSSSRRSSSSPTI